MRVFTSNGVITRVITRVFWACLQFLETNQAVLTPVYGKAYLACKYVCVITRKNAHSVQKASLGPRKYA